MPGSNKTIETVSDELKKLLKQLFLIVDKPGTLTVKERKNFKTTVAAIKALPKEDAPRENIDIVDRGWSALCVATCYGHADCVEALLAAGADPDFVAPPDGGTPVIMAAQNGHVACVKVLLAAGANPSAVSKIGTTALFYASQQNHPECVKVLLAAGADANFVNPITGNYALIVASSKGNTQCVEDLLAAGADPDYINLITGHYALRFAVDGNYSGCIKALAATDVDDSQLTTYRDIFDAAKKFHNQSKLVCNPELALWLLQAYTLVKPSAGDFDLDIMLIVASYLGSVTMGEVSELYNNRSERRKLTTAYLENYRGGFFSPGIGYAHKAAVDAIISSCNSADAKEKTAVTTMTGTAAAIDAKLRIDEIREKEVAEIKAQQPKTSAAADQKTDGFSVVLDTAVHMLSAPFPFPVNDREIIRYQTLLTPVIASAATLKQRLLVKFAAKLKMSVADMLAKVNVEPSSFHAAETAFLNALNLAVDRNGIKAAVKNYFAARKDVSNRVWMKGPSRTELAWINRLLFASVINDPINILPAPGPVASAPSLANEKKGEKNEKTPDSAPNPSRFSVNALEQGKITIEEIIAAAEKGDAEAQCALGYCYIFGKSVAQDDKKAFEWYEKAAKQGYARAQVNLGINYHHGVGVAQDAKQAFEWYEKAAKQGYAYGQTGLGYCYHEGDGVAKDLNKAFECYKAAATVDGRAQYSLGICFRDGAGVGRDEKTAVFWFKKAANNGEELAKAELKAATYRDELLSRFADKLNFKDKIPDMLSAAQGSPSSLHVAVSTFLCKLNVATTHGEIVSALDDYFAVCDNPPQQLQMQKYPTRAELISLKEFSQECIKAEVEVISASGPVASAPPLASFDKKDNKAEKMSVANSAATVSAAGLSVLPAAGLAKPSAPSAVAEPEISSEKNIVVVKHVSAGATDVSVVDADAKPKRNYKAEAAATPIGKKLKELDECINQLKGLGVEVPTIEHPDLYICPFSLGLMVEPVNTVNGQTYDSYAIEEWFEKNSTDPLTDLVLSDKTLRPIHKVKGAILTYVEGLCREYATKVENAQKKLAEKVVAVKPAEPTVVVVVPAASAPAISAAAAVATTGSPVFTPVPTSAAASASESASEVDAKTIKAPPSKRDFVVA